MSKNVVELFDCGGNMTLPNWNQRFTFTHHRDIRQNDQCWDLRDIETGSPIQMVGCHDQQGNQMWRYFPVSQALPAKM
jgi:Ricin-type beta-trefoil lectin domain